MCACMACVLCDVPMESSPYEYVCSRCGDLCASLVTRGGARLEARTCAPGDRECRRCCEGCRRRGRCAHGDKCGDCDTSDDDVR